MRPGCHTCFRELGQTRVVGHLVHDGGVGDQDPQVDVDGRHHAAFQLVLAELHGVYVVQLQNQALHGRVCHVRPHAPLAPTSLLLPLVL